MSVLCQYLAFVVVASRKASQTWSDPLPLSINRNRGPVHSSELVCSLEKKERAVSDARICVGTSEERRRILGMASSARRTLVGTPLFRQALLQQRPSVVHRVLDNIPYCTCGACARRATKALQEQRSQLNFKRGDGSVALVWYVIGSVRSPGRANSAIAAALFAARSQPRLAPRLRQAGGTARSGKRFPQRADYFNGPQRRCRASDMPIITTLCAHALRAATLTGRGGQRPH